MKKGKRFGALFLAVILILMTAGSSFIATGTSRFTYALPENYTTNTETTEDASYEDESAVSGNEDDTADASASFAAEAADDASEIMPESTGGSDTDPEYDTDPEFVAPEEATEWEPPINDAFEELSKQDEITAYEILLTVAVLQYGVSEHPEVTGGAADGEVRAWNRFGEALGDAYAPFDTSFVNFILAYAENNDIPPADLYGKIADWADVLHDAGFFRLLNNEETADLLARADALSADEDFAADLAPTLEEIETLSEVTPGALALLDLEDEYGRNGQDEIADRAAVVEAVVMPEDAGFIKDHIIAAVAAQHEDGVNDSAYREPADHEIPDAYDPAVEDPEDELLASRLAYENEETYIQFLTADPDGKVVRTALAVDSPEILGYVFATEEEATAYAEALAALTETVTAQEEALAEEEQKTEEEKKDETKTDAKAGAKKPQMVIERPGASEETFAQSPLLASPSNIGSATASTMTNGDLVITSGTGPIETIKDPAAVNGEFQRWTGESFSTAITVNYTDPTNPMVMRVYFRFSDPDGKSVSHSTTNTTTYTIEDQAGNTVEYTFNKVSDEDDLYFFEIDQTKLTPGTPLTFTVLSAYPSPSSDGGTLKIWGEQLTASQAAALGRTASSAAPASHHACVWDYETDDYPISKTDASKDTAIRYDSATGKYFAEGIAFYVDISRTQNGPYGVGRNPMIDAEFTDKLTLPSDASWNPEVISAIRDGRIGYNRYIHGTWIYYMDSNDKWQLFCYVKDRWNITSDAPHYVYLSLNSNNDPIVSWKHDTHYTSGEISTGHTPVISYGDSVIQISNPSVGKTYTFHNDVTATETFTHGQVVTKTASAETTIEGREAHIELTKTHGNAAGLKYGDPFTFEITAENTGVEPVSATAMEDTLPAMYYMTPEQILRTYYDAEGDSLTLTLTNARLCTVHALGSVLDSNGNTTTPQQQHSGSDCEYDGMKSTDPCMLTDNATITITRSNGILTIRTSAPGLPVTTKTVNMSSVNSEETLVSKAAELDAALKEIGLVITPNVRYKTSWNLGGQIHGGNTVTRRIYANVKDDFMLLSRDTRYNAAATTSGTNTAVITGNPENPTATDTSVVASRVWKLHKNATVEGREITETDSLVKGRVIDYALTVERNGGKTENEALPLVDSISGAQILLVPEANNSHLASMGLDTQAVDGANYYVLKLASGETEKEFTNITFPAKKTVDGTASKVGMTAASVTVRKMAGGGYETLIKWYLNTNDFDNSFTLEVPYKVLVDPDETASALENDSYALDNRGYLGDHQSERLYDDTEFQSTQDGADKNIVMERGSSPDGDVLRKSSAIDEGQQITYRLTINKSGSAALELNNTQFYDKLPKWFAGVKGSTVTIDVPSQSTLTTLSGNLTNDWQITTQNPSTGTSEADQYYIAWNSNVRIRVTGDTYLYVTITLPTGEDWTSFIQNYGNSLPVNTFYVKEHNASVTHYPGGASSAALQKGVTETGIVSHGKESSSTSTVMSYYTFRPDTGAAGRSTYANERTYRAGYVIYYATLYNDGESRLYLNDLQDRLPEGFTFFEGEATNTGHPANTTTSHDSAQKQFEWTSDSRANAPVLVNDNALTGKLVGVTAVIDPDDPQHLTFSFSNTLTTAAGDGATEGDVSEDSNRGGKLYLNPGEMISFVYTCLTNAWADSEDAAINKIAMPYDDYRGTGIQINGQTGIEATEFADNINNDGTRTVEEESALSGTNFDLTDDAQTKWLVSDVTIEREPIAPSITKKITRAQPESGSATSNPAYVGRQDTLTWQVTARNESKTPIVDYVISDVVDYPYLFTGDVSISLSNPNGNSLSCPIISFQSWSEDRNIAYINARNEIYGRDSNKALVVDGDPIQIRGYVWGDNNLFQVSLTSEGTGIKLNVRPQGYVRFDTGNGGKSSNNDLEGFEIAENGTVTMTYSTKAVVQDPDDWNYNIVYNNAYITPLIQDFRNGDVSEGSPTGQTFKMTEGWSNAKDNGAISSYPDHRWGAALTKKTYSNKPSVINTAQVPIATDLFTTSNKEVFEKEKETNRADGNTANNKIVLPDSTALFTYVLNVNNVKENAIDRFVMIDNLPEKGDTLTFASHDRNSTFDVEFADDPNVRVELKPNGATEFNALSSGYTVEYSDSTTFTSDDWTGGNAANWSTTRSASSRSIRIRMNNDTSIPGLASIRVLYDAKINSNEVLNDESIAWNSFGYHYHVTGQADDLEASPNPVAIKAPPIPSLTKKLIDEDKLPMAAPSDETFSFIIYEGAPLTESQLDTVYGNTAEKEYQKVNSEALVSQISGRNFTLVMLTVPAGATESDTVKLGGCMKYTWDEMQRSWEVTEDPWIWQDGTTYNIIELEPDKKFQAAGMTDTTGASPVSFPGRSGATFTYDVKKSQSFEAMNMPAQPEPEGDIVITKTVKDPDGNVLSDDTTEFTFTLTLKDPDGILVDDKTYDTVKWTGDSEPETPTAGQKGTLTVSNGTATFTLKHGEHIRIKGITYGSTYVIEETDLPAGYENVTPGAGKAVEGTVGSNTAPQTVDRGAANSFAPSDQAVTPANSGDGDPSNAVSPFNYQNSTNSIMRDAANNIVKMPTSLIGKPDSIVEGKPVASDDADSEEGATLTQGVLHSAAATEFVRSTTIATLNGTPSDVTSLLEDLELKVADGTAGPDVEHWTNITFQLNFIVNPNGVNSDPLVEPGDYITVTWPQASAGNAAITPHENEFDVKDENGLVYAKAYVTHEGARIVFTNALNTHYRVDGHVKIMGRLKKYDNTDTTPETFTIEVGGKSLTYTVTSTVGQMGTEDIDKWGSKDSTGVLDWTVNLNEPATDNRYTGEIVIEDVFGDGYILAAYDPSTGSFDPNTTDPDGLLRLFVQAKSPSDSEKWMTAQEYYDRITDPEEKAEFEREFIGRYDGGLNEDGTRRPTLAQALTYEIRLLYYGDDYSHLGDMTQTYNGSGYVTWSYGNGPKGTGKISEYLGERKIDVTPTSITTRIPADKLNGRYLRLNYYTRITDPEPNNELYENKAKMTFTTTQDDEHTDHSSYEVKYNESTGEASGVPYDTIRVTKTVAGTTNPIAGIYFEVTKVDDENYLRYLVTNSEGQAELTQLDAGTYYVRELSKEEAATVYAKNSSLPAPSYPKGIVVDARQKKVLIKYVDPEDPKPPVSYGNNIKWKNTIEADEIEFVNVKSNGGFTLTKELTGNGVTAADATTSFTFTIKTYKTQADRISGTIDTSINGTYGDVTFTNGVGTITLVKDQTVTVSNLPIGENYVIEETPPDSFAQIGENNNTKITGTVEEGDPEDHAHTYVNKKAATPWYPTVVKKIDGMILDDWLEEHPDAEGSFTFTATYTNNNNASEVYVKTATITTAMTAEEREAELAKLGHAFATADGFGDGKYFKVEIAETACTGDFSLDLGSRTYWLLVQNNTQNEVVVHETAKPDGGEAIFNNMPTVELTVKKTVASGGFNPNGTFQIRIEIDNGRKTTKYVPTNESTQTYEYSDGELYSVYPVERTDSYGAVAEGYAAFYNDSPRNRVAYKHRMAALFLPESLGRYVHDIANKRFVYTSTTGTLPAGVEEADCEKDASGATVFFNSWSYANSDPGFREGETLTIKGIPKGSSYTVTEIEGYNRGAASFSHFDENTEGTLDEDATATIVNYRLGVIKRDKETGERLSSAYIYSYYQGDGEPRVGEENVFVLSSYPRDGTGETTSSSNGYLGKRWLSLSKLGWYRIHESGAPSGYDLEEGVDYFIHVEKEVDDQTGEISPKITWYKGTRVGDYAARDPEKTYLYCRPVSSYEYFCIEEVDDEHLKMELTSLPNGSGRPGLMQFLLMDNTKRKSDLEIKKDTQGFTTKEKADIRFIYDVNLFADINEATPNNDPDVVVPDVKTYMFTRTDSKTNNVETGYIAFRKSTDPADHWKSSAMGYSEYTYVMDGVYYPDNDGTYYYIDGEMTNDPASAQTSGTDTSSMQRYRKEGNIAISANETFLIKEIENCTVYQVREFTGGYYERSGDTGEWIYKDRAAEDAWTISSVNDLGLIGTDTNPDRNDLSALYGDDAEWTGSDFVGNSKTDMDPLLAEAVKQYQYYGGQTARVKFRNSRTGILKVDEDGNRISGAGFKGVYLLSDGEYDVISNYDAAGSYRKEWKNAEEATPDSLPVNWTMTNDIAEDPVTAFTGTTNADGKMLFDFNLVLGKDLEGKDISIPRKGWVLLTEEQTPTGYRKIDDVYLIYYDLTTVTPKTFDYATITLADLTLRYWKLTPDNDEGTTYAFDGKKYSATEITGAGLVIEGWTEDVEGDGVTFLPIENKSVGKIIIKKSVDGFTKDEAGKGDAAKAVRFEYTVQVDIANDSRSEFNAPVTLHKADGTKETCYARFVASDPDATNKSYGITEIFRMEENNEGELVEVPNSRKAQTYLTMTANEWLEIGGLDKGAYYRVTELASYTMNDAHITNGITWTETSRNETGLVGNGDGIPDLTDKWHLKLSESDQTTLDNALKQLQDPADVLDDEDNASTARFLNIRRGVIKQDADTTERLDGVKFKLTALDRTNTGNGPAELAKSTPEKTATIGGTDANGKVTYNFGELVSDPTAAEGWILMEETETPEGYFAPEGVWLIHFKLPTGTDPADTTTGFVYEVKAATEWKEADGAAAKGAKIGQTWYKLTDVATKKEPVSHVYTKGETPPNDGVVYAVIDNRTLYELPSAGGPGTYPFTILGTMFLALAGGWLLLQNKRKEAVRR